MAILFSVIPVTPGFIQIVTFWEGKTIVLFGDFNINLFKHNDPNVIKFVDTLSSFSLNPYITLPTRISSTFETLIDNIFIFSNSFQTCSGNFTTGNLLSKSDFKLHVNSDESETWSYLKCTCGTFPDPCMIEDPVSPLFKP